MWGFGRKNSNNKTGGVGLILRKGGGTVRRKDKGRLGIILSEVKGVIIYGVYYGKF